MSKVVKAVTGGVKKVLKGAKKAFSSITKSSLGKILLIAATIYLGGAAMGMWNSPFASVNGAFVSGGGVGTGLETATAVTEAGGTMATAGEAAAGTAAGAGETAGALSANEAAVAETMTSAGGGGAAETLGGGIDLAQSKTIADAATYGQAADTAGKLSYLNAQTAAGKGFIGSMMSNPLAQYGMIQAGAGAIQGAFSPNALDVAEREAELQRENEQWRYDFMQPNFDVSNLNLGFRPAPQPVMRDANGNPIAPPQPGQPVVPTPPTGFIQNQMVRR